MNNVINGMNIIEVLTDLSKAISETTGTSVDVLNDISFTPKHLNSLLTCKPKHSNLYYVIAEIYKTTIPEWFCLKYTEVDDKQLEEYRLNRV
jgi:hypothetical protein